MNQTFYGIPNECSSSLCVQVTSLSLGQFIIEYADNPDGDERNRRHAEYVRSHIASGTHLTMRFQPRERERTLALLRDFGIRARTPLAHVA